MPETSEALTEQEQEWRQAASPNPQARRGYRIRDARIIVLLDRLVCERERVQWAMTRAVSLGEQAAKGLKRAEQTEVERDEARAERDFERKRCADLARTADGYMSERDALRAAVAALADELQENLAAFMESYEAAGEGICRRISGESAALLVAEMAQTRDQIRSLLDDPDAALWAVKAQVWDEGYTRGNRHDGRRDDNPYRDTKGGAEDE